MTTTKEAPAIITGIIARIVEEKGFGFIKVKTLSRDVFFHARDLDNIPFEQLQKGDKVQFEVYQSEKGYNAQHIEYVQP